MPSNQQRREAAKRKLERQLERRAERARKRKQMTIAGSIVGAIVVIAVGAVVVTLSGKDDNSTENTAASETPSAAAMPAGRAEPLPNLVNCAYTPAEAPAKPNNPPRAEGIDTTVATVSASMETTQGPIGLTLNNAESPCTVNSFVSLASQGYFDGTTCHRLVTGEGLQVLQCGDPTGTGSGGPGYQFANEFPTDQYAPDDLAAQTPVTYKRGTIAMANAGAGTNGSQFFLVYGDSTLPPQYTVFGTIDETGLQTIEKVAAAGDDGSMSAGGGKPNLPIDITSVRLD
ncbi:peptidylprolyl isomerase [Prescottella equi]|uniref:Peptidyl-prolyl cis-trans isomerase n=1 Tax=Rhodococcus hoagii TaxID=43767 RepID=A0AAE4ZGR1_RHOHA|nr:peptidylprolyl isomerase [Prescottella equi]MCD7050290.1 peptidylprolyl isomerase [Rhodococcus sp. BH2-1]MBM4536580.1 peptidylprolyl isomerase [Prescottella equi]MBM4630836.1 peptidylprolyl isomerase [Prescottella equi]NKR49880.1 peptidylprolyl isomerase [Prescottella equi]NKR63454.1 peptidylprolyl isomerase [Prescottella equi]